MSGAALPGARPFAARPASIEQAGSPPWRVDALAVTALLAAAAVVTILVFGDVLAYFRGDWPTTGFAWYAFLGERLRAFDIPGWTPHQLSGAPFAGDPTSGWGYLPAMALYALLPAEPATTLFLGFHVALSAVATYALARLLGLSPGSAFVAGAAYGFPWLIFAGASLVLFFQVTAWMPVALLGVELAVRPGPAWRRLGGIVVTGLAISQCLAAWTGQLGYYALLVIGGWVAWRALVIPPAGWSRRDRVVGLLAIGAGVLLVGLALNAAALLPRLDANQRSNVAGGEYAGISRWAASGTGRELEEIASSYAGGFTESSYAGAAVLTLALLAPVAAFRWRPIGFMALVPVAALILALPQRTPLHALLYAVLPLFETIHSHFPGRILVFALLPVALLAGAATDAVTDRIWGGQQTRLAMAVAGAVVLAGAILLERAGDISRAALAGVLATLAICAVVVLFPVAGRRLVVPLALAALVLWDPAGRLIVTGWGPGAGPERSLRAALAGEVEEFLYANGAAEFIAGTTEDEPGRYAGYDPALLPDVISAGDEPKQAYRKHWLGPANWLLVSNWATWFGLDDIQGYNPVMVQRYVAYIDVMNGHRQEYHEADLFPGGLDSPLLDLLNVRYLIVPADAPARPDLAPVIAAFPAVYEDEHVSVLENPEALPRAWLVHDAAQVEPGVALTLLADGTVDPRQTALLEEEPPPLKAPADAAREAVSYVAYEPDRSVIEVTADAPALLMLSEIWDPGWQATVNGAPAPVLLVDHTLRAVPVPTGEHVAELRYAPRSLQLGMGITVATVMLVVAGIAGLYYRDRRAK
jgi:hypothetical protein